MKVEIWSDVMCPFCYIGKRKFESALQKFGHSDKVEVEWKSFQLNPNMVTDPSRSTMQYLAETKGWSIEQTKNSMQHVSEMAKGVGLTYNFEKAVVANSFDAHRFIQFAKTKGKGDAAEESLFKAYFTEGKNTADHEVIIELAKSIGLDENETRKILSSNVFAKEVVDDITEAQKIGVRGVPFFVLDRKYAVSGAQDPEHFYQALSKAWDEQKNLDSSDDSGAVCTPDGECN